MKRPDNAIERLADEIVALLRRKTALAPTPDSLIKKFRVSSVDVERALEALHEWGYDIEFDRNGKMTLIGAPDTLTTVEISHDLKTKVMGKVLHAYRSVQSTNSVASQLAAAGAAEGEMVISETQTRGRGRLGRSWHSAEKVGAYFSLILRPKIEPAQAPALSIVAGLALTAALEKTLPGALVARLKWPNDVYISSSSRETGRKVAGILTELTAEVDRVHCIIVGIGININHRKNDFPDELRDRATSLRIVTKGVVNRVEIIQSFLIEFERSYALFLKKGFTAFRRDVADKMLFINQMVKVKEIGKGGAPLMGRAIGLDDSGRLTLETANGRIALTSGEVTLHKE